MPGKLEQHKGSRCAWRSARAGKQCKAMSEKTGREGRRTDYVDRMAVLRTSACPLREMEAFTEY